MEIIITIKLITDLIVPRYNKNGTRDGCHFNCVIHLFVFQEF